MYNLNCFNFNIGLWDVFNLLYEFNKLYLLLIFLWWMVLNLIVLKNVFSNDIKKCMFVIFCFYCYVLVIVNVLMFGIVDIINGFFYM